MTTAATAQAFNEDSGRSVAWALAQPLGLEIGGTAFTAVILGLDPRIRWRGELCRTTQPCEGARAPATEHRMV
jgi:hypothetical protein